MSLLSRVSAFIKSEPALLVTGVADAISFGADFGLHLTADQQKGLFGLASALTALIVRQTVTPNAAVQAMANGTADVSGRLATLEAAVSELAGTGVPNTTPAPVGAGVPVISSK